MRLAARLILHLVETREVSTPSDMTYHKCRQPRVLGQLLAALPVKYNDAGGHLLASFMNCFAYWLGRSAHNTYEAVLIKISESWHPWLRRTNISSARYGVKYSEFRVPEWLSPLTSCDGTLERVLEPVNCNQALIDRRRTSSWFYRVSDLPAWKIRRRGETRCQE